MQLHSNYRGPRRRSREGNGTPLQYSCLENPMDEEPGGLQSMGLLRVGHDWATSFSCIGEGNGTPLQCSCLENPRNGGPWWAAVYGVAQSQTRLMRRRSISSSSSRGLRLQHFFLAEGHNSIHNRRLGWNLIICTFNNLWGDAVVAPGTTLWKP